MVRKIVIQSVIFFSLFSMQINAQILLSSIKNAGIKSEQDLINLGVSRSEIDKLKSDYKNSQDESKTTLNKEIPIAKTNTPVDNEKEVTDKPNEKEVAVKPSDSIITESALYGKSAFKNGFTTIKENSDRIVPPNYYSLGSGDRISITIWGTTEFSNEFTLDEFGNISPSQIGRINLKGKTFSEAKSIIKNRFGRFYNLNSSKISIDLSFSKIISVNVVGEVSSPGTYSVPSINSAFNILSLAGGVNNLGTLRNIKIIREGKIISTLDVYQFLNNPILFKHTSLQDGDFISVQPAKGYIEFSGALRRPGKYEILENELLVDLISFAGGFTSYADKEGINIIKVENNALSFNSVSFESAQKNKQQLNFGDQINVLKISSLIRNIVTIEGCVNVPGRYSFNKGDKVSDLIKKANGLNYNAFKQIAHIVRQKDDLSKNIISINLNLILKNPQDKNNIRLEEFDVLKIINRNSLLIQKNITVSGMVQSPNTLLFYDGLKLKDVIVQTGGLKQEADSGNIQIERVYFQKDSSESYIRTISLKYPQAKEFELKEYDQINFRQLPEFSFHRTIELKGEVKYPGKYSLNGKNETLMDVIIRAGGLTDWAFKDGAKLYRSQDSLGLLLMNLADGLKNKNSKFNYILKPGDVLTIPKSNNIVSITGAIGYKIINSDKPNINTPFHSSRRASYYIKKYGGGYNSNAKRREVYTISSSGHVKNSKFFGVLKPYIRKGDKIIVEFKQPKKKKEKSNPINWNSIIENTTTKLTGILTLLILANTAFSN